MTRSLTGLLVCGAVAGAMAQPGRPLLWTPGAPSAEERSFVAPSATTRISDAPRVLASDIQDARKFKNGLISPRVVVDNPYLDPADPFFNIPRAMACSSATTVLDRAAVCPAGDPEHTIRMTDMLWDPVHDELVTSGTHYFDPAPKTNFYSTVWRISPDGRTRRVYLGLRLGRGPSAIRTGGISGLALDPQGRIHFGAIINEASASQIRRLDEATGVAAVVAGSSRPTDVAYSDGAANQAHFGIVRGVCFAPNGTMFVHDASLVIRKITPAGQVTTWAF